MDIKELNSSDLEEIKIFYRNVFGAPPWNEDWSDDVKLDEYMKDLTEVRNPIIYGLYDNEELVGLSIGKIKHWYEGVEYYLEEFCIRQDYQGKGMGSRFISLIKDNLKEKDIHVIYLMTDVDKPAYHFYKKNGFKEIPELTSFYIEF